MSEFMGRTNDSWPSEAPGWKDDFVADSTVANLHDAMSAVELGGIADNQGGDNACRNCGQVGHYSRECPEPRKQGGACFNCGEEGHNKVDCPNPRKENRECRLCNQQGHLSTECATRKCKQCLQEGHDAIDCKNAKFIDRSKVLDRTKEEAWEMIKSANEERDVTEVKEAVNILCKAVPSYTYVQLEQEFRKRELQIHLIAMEKDITDTFTNVDLQGNTGKKYVVGYYWNEKAQRPNLLAKWPPSPKENLVRLEDAGIPVERGVDKCLNCKQIGHTSRQCKEDKVEVEKAKISCANCNEDGHRVRDCPQARPQPGAGKECRNCGEEGHMSRDCPTKEKRTCRNCGAEDHMARDCPTKEKRTCRNCGAEDHMARDCPNPRKITCRNCGSEEHMARECDQPPNPANMQCRNCDEMGHMSRECPKPTDWSRVTCKNCGEKGHTVKRCTKPVQAENDPSAAMAATHAVEGWTIDNNLNTSEHQDWEIEGNPSSTPATAPAVSDW